MKTIYKKEMKDFFTEVKHSIIKESKNAILSGFKKLPIALTFLFLLT